MTYSDKVTQDLQGCGDPFQALTTVMKHYAQTRRGLEDFAVLLAAELHSTRQLVHTLESLRDETAGQMRDVGVTVTEIAALLGLTDSATSKAIKRTGRASLRGRRSSEKTRQEGDAGQDAA